MKIPTLLALALLLVAITLGVMIAFLTHRVSFTQPPTLAPFDINVANVTDSSATITWQTKETSEGVVSFGESQSLGTEALDIRDSQTSPHITHFVTINNLKENTTYFFKVRSNLSYFPDKPLTFKTAQKSQTTSTNKSIYGVVLRSDLAPIDEAILTLHINGGSDLATITTTAGNFILPLSDLKNSSLSDNLNINQEQPATLVVERAESKSTVKLNLPLGDQPLPKIILGQDSDFSSLPVDTPSPSTPDTNRFDLNSDGKVNSIDMSILLESLGKKSTDPNFNDKADLNNDGIIDQADVDLMKKALGQ